MCVIKKYNSYSVGQPFVLQECNVEKRKSKFFYTESTGLISHESDRTEWNDFCVQAQDGNDSRLKVAVCDQNDASQVWDFDSLNQHVHLRAGRRRCVVAGPIGEVDGGAVWMKISNKCASNSWGTFEE